MFQAAWGHATVVFVPLQFCYGRAGGEENIVKTGCLSVSRCCKGKCGFNVSLKKWGAHRDDISLKFYEEYFNFIALDWFLSNTNCCLLLTYAIVSWGSWLICCWTKNWSEMLPRSNWGPLMSSTTTQFQQLTNCVYIRITQFLVNYQTQEVKLLSKH